AYTKSASTGLSQLTIGAANPASRNARPSAMLVTPSHVAPFSSAVRAAGTQPCPKPSAFTTAITPAFALETKNRVLAATAARSTVSIAPCARSFLVTAAGAATALVGRPDLGRPDHTPQR